MAQVPSLSAEYLGWKPTDGVSGRQFVTPVVRDLVERRRGQRVQLKRHVLDFASKRKLRIWEAADPRAGGRPGNRYPSVPVTDITFALQEDGDSDPLLFSLIMLGFNEESNRSIHVHVWRGQSVDAVAVFVGRLVRCLCTPDHLNLVRQRERELVRQGEARPSGYFDTDLGRGDIGSGRDRRSASSLPSAAAPPNAQAPTRSPLQPPPPAVAAADWTPPSCPAAAPPSATTRWTPPAASQPGGGGGPRRRPPSSSTGRPPGPRDHPAT